MAGSSSQDATETAYPTNRNRTNTGYTYLSSATVQKTYSTNTYEVLNPTSADLHTRGQYDYGYPSTTINGNTTTNISEAAAFALKYPTNPYLHGSGSHGHSRVIMIPANITFDDFLTGSLNQYVTQSALIDGSYSPLVKTITADKFTTTYTNGNVLVVGDDTIVKDVNLANGFGIIGQQAATKGWVKFGSGSNAPLVGYNNTDNFPAAGDGIYSVTGSMLIKTNKLYFFNGGASNNGWSQII
jgi:hypothetical protein